MYKPDRQFDEPHACRLIGRAVRVLVLRPFSGPGDIAVLDEASGTLFAGGLLDAARVPDIQDSDLPGWHRALASLRTCASHGGARPRQRLVGGADRHGGGYLAALERACAPLVTAGTSLLGVPDAAELPAYERWDQYDWSTAATPRSPSCVSSAS